MTRLQPQVLIACAVAIQERRLLTVQAGASPSKKSCSFCGAAIALAEPICVSCAAPAAIPETVSYYSYFPGFLPPPQDKFNLDTRLLRREFLKLQQLVHPDKFSDDGKKRLIAESTSSLINKAYSSLKAPLSRAEYLLNCHGIDVSNDGEVLTEGKILMTVMEMREQIEDAKIEDDLTELKEEIELLIQAELEALESLFGQSNWTQAKVNVIKLRYWLNIRTAIDAWEPSKSG